MCDPVTERNQEFEAQAEAALGSKGAPVIVYCSRGGSLETETVRVTSIRTKRYNDPEKAFGLESRSLKACYHLLEAGFTNVMHLKGGISQWRYDGLPVSDQ